MVFLDLDVVHNVFLFMSNKSVQASALVIIGLHVLYTVLSCKLPSYVCLLEKSSVCHLPGKYNAVFRCSFTHGIRTVAQHIRNKPLNSSAPN